MLDQKVWLNVKYSIASERIDFVGNHCLSAVTDNESYEKLLLFGGISNEVGDTMADLKSTISNRTFIVTVQQRTSGKSLFKEVEKKESALGSKVQGKQGMVQGKLLIQDVNKPL